MIDSTKRSKWLFTLTLLVFITGAWMAKNLYFVQETGLISHNMLILLSSLGLSFLLGSILTAKKTKWLPVLTFFLYLALSVLLYADVLYARYYYAILKVELIVHAGQIRDISDSIFSLIYKSDIWYFVDLPILAIALFFLYRRISFGKFVSWSFAGAGTVIILFITLFALKLPYSDQYKVSIAGIIPAHVYDLSYNLYKKFYLGQTYLKGESLHELQTFLEKKQEVQKASPYFGEYKGKNLIVVQAESLNVFPIGIKVGEEEVTPILNELISTSHYYPNTYLQIGRGNTSDAEFVANNSIYPMSLIGAYKGFTDNSYLSLGNVLNSEGYKVSATHGNRAEFWNRKEAYPYQGFEEFYHIDHPKIDDGDWVGMGISDESIFRQMVQIYKEEQKPFYNFIVSLSCHRPFELPKELQYLNLPSDMDGTATGHYLQSVKYFDYALGIFIEELKKEGLWDDTIFVVYGDHYGPLPKDGPEIEEQLGVVFDEEERFKVPLIIHHPGQTEGVLNTGVGSQMDIYPTLSALLGIDQPLVQFGTTLDADFKQVVGFAYETNRYSFYSDDYMYAASHTGVFEEGTCTKSENGEAVDVQACREGYDRVYKDIQTSTVLLEHDFITKIFK
ncbi:LTA synthase family protein [Cytobacillus sp. FJAT-54145]|uniref:LTA synthase family protein n=1 Tax=Cytobacillus spartinae TaxID=3299023 RepID=A0ABW6KEU3_9BACI